MSRTVVATILKVEGESTDDIYVDVVCPQGDDVSSAEALDMLAHAAEVLVE